PPLFPYPTPFRSMNDTPEERFSRRSIRSFVLRQGRMTVGQQRALDEMMPRIGLPYRPQPVDLDALFGRDAPRVLEVGFGMGETTARIAARSEEHTSELQSRENLVCRLLL